MSTLGIYVNKFASHCVSSALASRAEKNSIPRCNISNFAGWSNAGYFVMLYKRPKQKDAELYQHTVLKHLYLISLSCVICIILTF